MPTLFITQNKLLLIKMLPVRPACLGELPKFQPTPSASFPPPSASRTAVAAPTLGFPCWGHVPRLVLVCLLTQFVCMSPALFRLSTASPNPLPLPVL